MSRPLSKIIGATVLVQLFNFALVLLNNVLISRWLGPLQLGIMATVLILAESINKFSNMGQETSLVYFIGNRRFPQNTFISTSLINGVMIFLLGVSMIAVFIWLGGVSLLLEPGEILLLGGGIWWCVYLLFASELHEYGTKIWLGRQLFKRYNQNLLFRPVIYLVLVLLAYWYNWLTIGSALFIYATSWLLPGLYIYIKSVFPLKLVWDKTISRISLQYGIKTMFANMLVYLIYRADIFLIGYFLSQREVGWYYVAVMIAERLLYLTHASSTILFSAASYAEGQHQKIPLLVRSNLWIVLLGAILLALVVPYLLPLLFSMQYQASVLPLIALLPGVVFITIPKLLAADFLARGKPQLNLYINIVNFSINIVLNLLLIPRYGIIGAAVSSSISYGAAALVGLFLYKRLTGVTVFDLILPRPGDLQGLKKL